MKDVIVLGEPNGAEKTTAAPHLLPNALGIMQFVNADDIARGLSGFEPESQAIAAGRLMLERLQSLARQGENFAFETTRAGRGHAHFLRGCRRQGYRLTLIYLWLPSAAIARVKRRVAQGGHAIVEDVVKRRYLAGLRNMRDLYLPLADIATIYDNSDGHHVIIATKLEGNALQILDPDRWSAIGKVLR